jgi:Na+(H+)/acetate symporter ActP
LKKQSKLGAIAGTLGGLASGLTAWLVAAKTLYGELTVTTTESSYATLAGSLAGVLIGLFLTVVISYIKPDNFDQKVTRQINTSPIVGTSPAGLLVLFANYCDDGVL